MRACELRGHTRRSSLPQGACGRAAAPLRCSPQPERPLLARRARLQLPAAAAGEASAPLVSAASSQLPSLADSRPGEPRRWQAAFRAAVCVSVLACALAGCGPASAAASTGAPPPSLLSFVLHFDKHLAALVADNVARAYSILALIVFCETGLVVTPFLPGDSLLFAAGALCALNALSLPLLVPLLVAAAVLGDGVNYAAGAWLGARAFERHPAVFRPEYLAKTRDFFGRYGAKAIVMGRFVPIVRTFAPFVAGVGEMPYTTFALYNVVGAIVWVASLTLLGFALGNVPVVRANFALVTVAIIVVSVVPIVVEMATERREAK